MGKKVEVDPDEMIQIMKLLNDIVVEFTEVVEPAVKSIGEQKYVTKGAALPAMKKVPAANQKVLELSDHYQRSATLVADILNKMMETDQSIAEKVVKALDLGGEQQQ